MFIVLHSYPHHITCVRKHAKLMELHPILFSLWTEKLKLFVAESLLQLWRYAKLLEVSMGKQDLKKILLYFQFYFNL